MTARQPGRGRVGWKLGLLLQVAAGIAVTLVLLAVVEFSCGFFIRASDVIEQATSLRSVEGDAVSKTLTSIDLNPVPLVTDIDLLWRNKPLAIKMQPINPRRLGQDDTWTVEINSEGYRGPERPFKRQRDGVYRILCIGDSVTYGFNVDQNAPFSRQLENLLRQQFPAGRIEVINAGVPGWSWVQGLRFLELEGLALHPDLVIMAHGMNDQFWEAKITDNERLEYLEKPLVRLTQHASIFFAETNTSRIIKHFFPAPSTAIEPISPACKRQIHATAMCRRVSLAEIEVAVHKVRNVTAAAGIDLLLLNLEFMGTPAVQAERRAVEQDHVPFVDFVDRFREWRQADDAERAGHLGLVTERGMEPVRQTDGASIELGTRHVLLRVVAPGEGAAISVKGSAYAPGAYQIEETMYDDGTHGDEVANDLVFSATIEIPPAVGAIRYKYVVNGTAEFIALPPLPSSHHDRVKLFEQDAVAPIEVLGEVFLMAELAHPNAQGHERIAAGIHEAIQTFPSFTKFAATSRQAAAGSR